MAWERRKSGPNSDKNQPFSLVSAIFLSFLSLSLHRGLRPPPFQPPSFRHRLHYQWSPELLTTGKAYTIDPSLSLLQIFFSFFLLALPPATSSNHRPHHRMSSSTARPRPRQVAFFSSLSSSSSYPPLSLLTMWIVDMNSYCSRMNGGREL